MSLHSDKVNQVQFSRMRGGWGGKMISRIRSVGHLYLLTEIKGL